MSRQPKKRIVIQFIVTAKERNGYKIRARAMHLSLSQFIRTKLRAR